MFIPDNTVDESFRLLDLVHEICLLTIQEAHKVLHVTGAVHVEGQRRVVDQRRGADFPFGGPARRHSSRRRRAPQPSVSKLDNFILLHLFWRAFERQTGRLHLQG